tara:strand:+ start:53 stop:640 length:588 start_codon:yes stop_codon:yes gene_type:complete
MNLKIFAFISCLLISVHAKGKLFIAPGLYYIISGNHDVTYTGGSSANTVEGYVGNLKLGLSNGTFSFGGVVQRGKAELINSSGTSIGYSWYTRIGGFIGYTLPMKLTFGVSYNLPPLNHSESTYTGFSSGVLNFGVSYPLVSFLRLNVAYGMSVSPKYVVSGTANDLPYTSGVTYKEFTTSSLSAGIEVPISLGF